MRDSRFTRLLGIVLLLALVLGVVSMAGAQDKKIIYSGINQVGDDPETLDTALGQDNRQIQVIEETYVGLTRLDELTASVKPGLADSWDISADGLTITYHLHPGIPWVNFNAATGQVEEVKDDAGNVRTVTAHDLVYGWQRTVNPETASPYAYVLTPYVTGGNEINADEAEPSTLGVKAIDDVTFEVTMPAAVAFAPLVHGLWPANAQPQWAIEAHGEKWTEPENINTYGPFALKEWNHDENIVLIKNPFWPTDIPSVQQPKVDEVVLEFQDQQTQFQNYQAGNLDGAEVPLEQIDLVKSDPVLSQEYSNGTDPCTYFIGFNTTKPPMDNVHIRRALSYAIDRQSIVDNVTKGGQIPARWFVRPGLNAAPTPETNPDLGVYFDAAKANEELAAGLADMSLASAADLPPITLAYNDSANHGLVMQAVQQMWSQNLGINVQLAPMDGTTYFTLQNQDANQAFRSGWCQDYPDANNFNEILQTGSPQNGPKYSSSAYDQLVDEARTESDQAKRLEMYAEAENLLVVEDAAVAPIYWYTTNQVTKPYVTRTNSVIGYELYENWDINRPAN